MTSFISSAELAALILFGIIQACCVPIPSEVTFGLAGVLASEGGHLSLPLVIIIGTLAEMVGSYISYYVGYKGGKPLVHRFGRYVLITESDIDRAERFLAGRGAWAVPLGRMTPFVRAVTSIVAGMVRIPPLKFGVLSLIGTAIYATVVSSIGYSVGKSGWDAFNHKFSYASYVIVAVVVVALVAFVALRYRQFKRESGKAGAGDGPGGAGTGPRRGRHSAGQRN